MGRGFHEYHDEDCSIWGQKGGNPISENAHVGIGSGCVRTNLTWTFKGLGITAVPSTLILRICTRGFSENHRCACACHSSGFHSAGSCDTLILIWERVKTKGL